MKCPGSFSFSCWTYFEFHYRLNKGVYFFLLLSFSLTTPRLKEIHRVPEATQDIDIFVFQICLGKKSQMFVLFLRYCIMKFDINKGVETNNSARKTGIFVYLLRIFFKVA